MQVRWVVRNESFCTVKSPIERQKANIARQHKKAESKWSFVDSVLKEPPVCPLVKCTETEEFSGDRVRWTIGGKTNPTKPRHKEDWQEDWRDGVTPLPQLLTESLHGPTVEADAEELVNEKNQQQISKQQEEREQKEESARAERAAAEEAKAEEAQKQEKHFEAWLLSSLAGGETYNSMKTVYEAQVSNKISLKRVGEIVRTMKTRGELADTARGAVLPSPDAAVVGDVVSMAPNDDAVSIALWRALYRGVLDRLTSKVSHRVASEKEKEGEAAAFQAWLLASLAAGKTYTSVKAVYDAQVSNKISQRRVSEIMKAMKTREELAARSGAFPSQVPPAAAVGNDADSWDDGDTASATGAAGAADPIDFMQEDGVQQSVAKYPSSMALTKSIVAEMLGRSEEEEDEIVEEEEEEQEEEQEEEELEEEQEEEEEEAAAYVHEPAHNVIFAPAASAINKFPGKPKRYALHEAVECRWRGVGDWHKAKIAGVYTKKSKEMYMVDYDSDDAEEEDVESACLRSVVEETGRPRRRTRAVKKADSITIRTDWQTECQIHNKSTDMFIGIVCGDGQETQSLEVQPLHRLRNDAFVAVDHEKWWFRKADIAFGLELQPRTDAQYQIAIAKRIQARTAVDEQLD